MKTKTIWYVILVLLCCGAVLAVQQAATKQLPTKQSKTSLSHPAKTPVKSVPVTAGNPAARAIVKAPTVVEPAPCDDPDAVWMEVEVDQSLKGIIRHMDSDSRTEGTLDQGTDACPGTVIASIPYSITGTTTGYTNDYNAVCGWTSTGLDVVYQYVCTADMLVDISLCATGSTTDFDTRMYVYKSSCGGTSCYRSNDDWCSTSAITDYVSFIGACPFDAGYTYYIVVDGYGSTDFGNYTLTIDPSNWVPENPCPAGSIFSQPPYNAADQWTAFLSDRRDQGTNYEYYVFDEYSVAEPICDVHWWGITVSASGVCTEDPMTFEIKFYADNSGMPDYTVPACTYTATVTGTAVATWGTYTLYSYSVNLDPCCTQLSGWVSIEGVSDPNTCWFYWAASPIGNAYSLAYRPGTPAWYFRYYDAAICLTPGEEELYGACCYTDTWTCEDNVLSTDCIALGGIFYANQLCTEITCEEPVECVVECPVGGTPEGELCTEDLNGGCNMDVPAYTPITCDQTVCGLSWADGTTRDTDWYQIVLASPMTVTITAQTEFQAVAGFVDFPPCVDGTTEGVCDLVEAIAPYVELDSCVEGQVSSCLPAGTWWLFVAPASYTDVVDCRDYYLTVTCAPCTVPVAACCYGDPSAPQCADVTECECEQLGGTWYEGEACATFECPEEVLCPEGTMYGQRPHNTEEDWQFVTSELNPGYVAYDDFYSVSGPISAVTFYGINLFYSSGWQACTENPMSFAIGFYNFDPTDPTLPELTTPVATYTLSLTGTPVDVLFNGSYQEYQHTAVLDPPVALNPGWISIQGQGAEDCWFLWSSSPEGFDGSLQWSGSAWTVNEANRAFCFAPAPCDPVTDVTAYLITGGVQVYFTAPAAGDYDIYSTTNPNNDGDPDGGGDPAFALETSLVVAAAGETSWVDAAYLASSYKNYVVVRTCASFEVGVGRCCYGVQYQTCEEGVTWEYCDALEGNWYYTLTCPCPAPAYCTASSTCDEYISAVVVGTINNVVDDCGTNGYTDYTALSTNMTIGTGYLCSVTNGYAYEYDQLGIWVDWNGDLDFDDADETIAVNNPDYENFDATITPPAGASVGATRMRVRLAWNTTPVACGTMDYGETEDYTINVVAP
ncbi:MAG: GEVED domain-containing protein [bacterium]|nr:GEVED domain-containing protein [bacterium]